MSFYWKAFFMRGLPIKIPACVEKNLLICYSKANLHI